MNKEEKTSFFRWMCSADRKELEERLLRVQRIAAILKEDTVISDANWMARKIEEELLARREAGD